MLVAGFAHKVKVHILKNFLNCGLTCIKVMLDPLTPLAEQKSSLIHQIPVYLEIPVLRKP